MSVVIHGDNFIELQQGQAVHNVDGSAGDTIIIKFNGHYFVPNQYSSYVRQLITNRHIVVPQVSQNITPSSWLGVWRHFTNQNPIERVICCACNERRATVGGHAVLGNQNREVEHGSNSVFIIPICGRCNGQNENLNINRDIQAVKLFDYYNGYYGDSFITDNEYRIRITHIEISQQILQQLQDTEQDAGAHYGEIDQQGREGQAGQEGQRGRQGRQEPQAGQARPFIL